MLAIVLTLATIIGLVRLAGRLYTNAILHGGSRLSLKDAWRNTTTPARAAPARAPATRTLRHWARGMAEGTTTMTRTDLTSHRLLITVLTGIGVILGVAVGVLTSDVILGLIAESGFLAVATSMVKLWNGHGSPPIAHP